MNAFQFTTSQGGRRKAVIDPVEDVGLSIHDLTRRSTSMAITSLNQRIFQFTTSQGGRRRTTYLIIFIGRTFNSRPHKEVDHNLLNLLSSKNSFNSRPHKEVDRIRRNGSSVPNIFQFTTSQGGRRREDELFIPAHDLSIHDLTRRSTRQ